MIDSWNRHKLSTSPLAIFVILMLVVGLFPQDTIAQFQGKQRYQVTFETTASTARATIVRIPNSVAPRTESFQLVLRTFSNGTNIKVLSKKISIPKGAPSGQAEVYFSNSGWGIEYYLHVEQDNNGIYNRNRDLCRIELDVSDDYYDQATKILVASSNIATPNMKTWKVGNKQRRQSANAQASAHGPIPSVDKLAGYIDDLSYNSLPSSNFSSAISAIQSMPSITATPVDKLPKSWRGLVSTEVLILSFKDLRSICTLSPEIREALSRWASVGGTLVVNDCGKNFESANEIIPLLRTTEMHASILNRGTEWERPSKKLVEFPNYIMEGSYMPNSANGGPTVRKSSLEWSLEKQFIALDGPPSAPSQLLRTSYVRGNIIAVPDDMVAWKTQDWRVLINSHEAFPRKITSEVGMALVSGYPNIGFRVPGIGEPPVVAFQILITVFVILVGPIFYFLLKRMGRMHLLYFATPALSAIACFGIVAFAILSDGFETRGRVDSFTFVDHLTNAAVTHSQYAFYSGTVPAGYHFDSDTLISDERREYSQVTRLDVGDEKTRLSGGEISARNPHQVSTVNCFSTNGRLSVQLLDKNKIKVANHFGSRIRTAILHTKQGWFQVDNLEPDSTAEAPLGRSPESYTRLREMIEKHSPELDMNSVNFNAYSRGFNYYGGDPTYGAAAEVKQQLTNTIGLKDIVPVGSYLAISETDINDTNPNPQANYGNYQLHVIIGKW